VNQGHSKLASYKTTIRQGLQDENTRFYRFTEKSTATRCQAQDGFTSYERKSRMRQIRGVEGEAVISYCEPFKTREMADKGKSTSVLLSVYYQPGAKHPVGKPRNHRLPEPSEWK
jgi:hypothetical protein